jgi:hypothetical protein
MIGHVPSNFREIGLAGTRLINQRAVEHHNHPVGQFEQLVDIFADEQYPSTSTPNVFGAVGRISLTK